LIVRRKPLSCEQTCFSLGTLGVLLALGAVQSFGADTISNGAVPTKYLGAASCSSSGCHGGGGEHQNQFLVWSLKDFHSERPFATLTTARSKQIADALDIVNPAADNRCTSCHAPLLQVPVSLRGEDFKVSEGVSCESCHGPAEDWLRSHTRPDWTHADRVFAGMRELRNLYVRANTCVACHQTVELPLLKAGHPELIFELDGQSVSEPKHWREQTNWNGAQTWLVGQAAALREMSWQLTRSSERDAKLVARCEALLWLLSRLDGVNPELPKLSGLLSESAVLDYPAVQSAADGLARSAAAINWSDAMTRSMLKALAGLSPDFRQREIPTSQQARRAERLVLALDRLTASAPQPAANASLNELFKLAQSLPDFDPVRFSAAVGEFSLAIDR
jgi:Cytochrome c554 and c-prime